MSHHAPPPPRSLAAAWPQEGAGGLSRQQRALLEGPTLPCPPGPSRWLPGGWAGAWHPSPRWPPRPQGCVFSGRGLLLGLCSLPGLMSPGWGVTTTQPPPTPGPPGKALEDRHWAEPALRTVVTSRPVPPKSQSARKARSGPGRRGRRWRTQRTSEGGGGARPCPRPRTPAGPRAARCPEGNRGVRGQGREGAACGPRPPSAPRPPRTPGSGGQRCPASPRRPPRTLPWGVGPPVPGSSQPPCVASRRRSSMLTLQWRLGRLLSGGSRTCGNREAVGAGHTCAPRLPRPPTLGTPHEERSARSSPGSSSASSGRGASASRPAPVVAFRSSSAPGRPGPSTAGFSERGSAPGRGGPRSVCHGPSHWGQEGAGGRDPPSRPVRTSGEAGPGEGHSPSSPSKVKKKTNRRNREDTQRGGKGPVEEGGRSTR